MQVAVSSEERDLVPGGDGLGCACTDATYCWSKNSFTGVLGCVPAKAEAGASMGKEAHVNEWWHKQGSNLKAVPESTSMDARLGVA